MGNAEMEEKLREAACFGDIDGVKELLNRGVDVNAQHDINGWTALHWAAKRDHLNIVNLLCNHGADKSVPTNKGEVAAQLTTEGVIKVLLNAMKASSTPSGPKAQIKKESALPITPNYIRRPPLNYEVDLGQAKAPAEKRPRTQQAQNDNQINAREYHPPPQQQPAQPREVILKIRVANATDTDFIEMEMPSTALTIEYLIVLGCEELEISPHSVERVRKLPNTRLRRDREVERLQNYQEIEFVLKASELQVAEAVEQPIYNGVGAMEDGEDGELVIDQSNKPTENDQELQDAEVSKEAQKVEDAEDEAMAS